MHCTTGAVCAAAAGLAPAQTGGIYWEPPPSKLCENTMLQVYTLCITSVSHKSGCPDSGNHRRLPCEEFSQSSILQGREVSCPARGHALYMFNMCVCYIWALWLFLFDWEAALHGTGLSTSIIWYRVGVE